MAENKGKMLLGLIGGGGKSHDVDAEEGDDDAGEHPGKVQAMKDFMAAHAVGDHEGMSRALSAHHDIHMGSEEA